MVMNIKYLNKLDETIDESLSLIADKELHTAVAKLAYAKGMIRAAIELNTDREAITSLVPYNMH